MSNQMPFSINIIDQKFQENSTINTQEEKEKNFQNKNNKTLNTNSIKEIDKDNNNNDIDNDISLENENQKENKLDNYSTEESKNTNNNPLAQNCLKIQMENHFSKNNLSEKEKIPQEKILKGLFTCVICENILYSPFICKNCGETACYSCFSKSITKKENLLESHKNKKNIFCRFCKNDNANIIPNFKVLRLKEDMSNNFLEKYSFIDNSPLNNMENYHRFFKNDNNDKVKNGDNSFGNIDLNEELINKNTCRQKVCLNASINSNANGFSNYINEKEFFNSNNPFCFINTNPNMNNINFFEPFGFFNFYNSWENLMTQTQNINMNKFKENQLIKNQEKDQDKETSKNPNTNIPFSFSLAYKNNLSEEYIKNFIISKSKFYMIKSIYRENLIISKQKNIWATTPFNEGKLRESFRKNFVILIFSLSNNFHFFGCAVLLNFKSKQDAQKEWRNDRGVNLGQSFNIKWLSDCEIPIYKLNSMTNPLNKNFPLLKGKDCQEIPCNIGSYIFNICEKFSSSKISQISYKEIYENFLNGNSSSYK